MTDKEFRNMKRAELIEVIFEMQEREEALLAEITRLSVEVENRRIKQENVGSIAEASLQLNGVFEAAQASAQQYIDEIKKRREEIEEERNEIIENAREGAKMIISVAKNQAETIISMARSKAREINLDLDD
jgi:vacuolar-type H+-ATPase subunit H